MRHHTQRGTGGPRHGDDPRRLRRVNDTAAPNPRVRNDASRATPGGARHACTVRRRRRALRRPTGVDRGPV